MAKEGPINKILPYVVIIGGGVVGYNLLAEGPLKASIRLAWETIKAGFKPFVGPGPTPGPGPGPKPPPAAGCPFEAGYRYVAYSADGGATPYYIIWNGQFGGYFSDQVLAEQAYNEYCAGTRRLP